MDKGEICGLIFVGLPMLAFTITITIWILSIGLSIVKDLIDYWKS